jgi:hypothetical protein
MHTKRTKEKQKEEQFAEVEKEKKRFFHGNKCALGYTISQRNILRIH